MSDAVLFQKRLIKGRTLILFGAETGVQSVHCFVVHCCWHSRTIMLVDDVDFNVPIAHGESFLNGCFVGTVANQDD